MAFFTGREVMDKKTNSFGAIVGSAGLKRLLSVLKGLLARHQSMRLHRIIPYNHNTRLKKHIVGSLLVQC